MIRSWIPSYRFLESLAMDPKNVYVFGSNTKGIHGAGSALVARNLFDAIYGTPCGLQGRAYGIITKNLNMGIRSIPLDVIQSQILDFYDFASWNLDLNFYVDRIGCGLAGYAGYEIKPLFYKREYERSNVFLPEEFIN